MINIMATLFVARNPGNGEKVYIEHAQRKVPYTCLDCNSRLIARMGDKRVYHFAHKSKSKCKGETSSHLYCKHILEKQIHKTIFHSKCVTCKCTETKRFVPSDKNTIRTAQEYPWNQYSIDVAVLESSNNTLLGALEVYHSHRTTQTKMGDLAIHNIFVTDIDTYEIISKLTIECDEYQLCGTHICIQCYQARKERKQQNLNRTACVCRICDQEFHCTKLFGRTICSRDCYAIKRAAEWEQYNHKLKRMYENRVAQTIQMWSQYQAKIRLYHEQRVHAQTQRWVSYNRQLMQLHRNRKSREAQTIQRWSHYQEKIRRYHEQRVHAQTQRWVSYNRKLIQLHRKREQYIYQRIRLWTAYQEKLMYLHNKYNVKINKTCMHCGRHGVTLVLNDFLFLCSTACYQERLELILQRSLRN